MALRPFTLAIIATLGLAACGDTVTEQALIGGAVGAGAGAVVGGSVLTGAAIGVGANVLYCEVANNDC
ncbi:MAG: hypothetical protein ABJP79_08635 [Tateyamaria sp.]|uniref:hypothetical protein n=1 Tax=Tateyamaria sp. TaxID=1929288 RepID=UPI0032A04726